MARVAAVPDDVQVHQALDRRMLRLGQSAALLKDSAQWVGAPVQPLAHGFVELVARHEVHLQRQQPEQQVAIRGSGHGGTLCGDRSTVCGSLPVRA
jgi:hypothetical protein